MLSWSKNQRSYRHCGLTNNIEREVTRAHQNGSGGLIGLRQDRVKLHGAGGCGRWGPGGGRGGRRLGGSSGRNIKHSTGWD